MICAESWIFIVSFAELMFLTEYSEYRNQTVQQIAESAE